MTFFFWWLTYLGVLLAEASFLPRFFGFDTPLASLAVLTTGIASQEFRPAFWFAGLGGLAEDIMFSGTAAGSTAFALGVFFAMHCFLAFIPWDEPLDRIGAVMVGLLLTPLVWLATSVLAGALFEASFSSLGREGLASRFAIREIVFAAAWFSVFVAWTLHRHRKQRAAELTRL